MWKFISLVASQSTLFVVGDPDQSIYRFMGSDPSIFRDMEQDFQDVEKVILTKNYRSSQPILDVCTKIISQDENRIHSEGLHADLNSEATRNIVPIIPKLLVFPTIDKELRWVASTIKYLTLEQSIPIHDIAVLVRSSTFSSQITDTLESLLGVRTVVFGGTSLLESNEASTCLTILRMLHSPNKDILIMNLIRRFKLFITPKVLEAAIQRSRENNTSLIEVLRNHPLWVASKKSSGIIEFINMIDTCHRMLAENSRDMNEVLLSLNYCLNILEYEKSVKKMYKNSFSYNKRLLKMKEFKDYLVSITDYVEWELAKYPERTCLEHLLFSSSLYNITPIPDELVVSTVHAAKGLEWRVVFVVGTDDDAYPHIRSKDSYEAIDEERRILYVALSRARERLYVSYSKQGVNNGVFTDSSSSRFFTPETMNLFNVSPESEMQTADLWTSCKFKIYTNKIDQLTSNHFPYRYSIRRKILTGFQRTRLLL